MQVVAVPCLKDNFAYLLVDGDRAVCIDPSEAAPIEAALAANKLTLGAIWATHHHWDHTGGIADLGFKAGVFAGQRKAAPHAHGIAFGRGLHAVERKIVDRLAVDLEHRSLPLAVADHDARGRRARIVIRCGEEEFIRPIALGQPFGLTASSRAVAVSSGCGRHGCGSGSQRFGGYGRGKVGGR